MVVSPCGDGDNGPGRVQGCSDAAFAQDLDVGPLVEGCGWCQYDAVCHKVAGNPHFVRWSVQRVPCQLSAQRATRFKDTQARHKKLGLRNATAGRIGSCFKHVQVRVPLFCREDGLHGGVPWEVSIAV